MLRSRRVRDHQRNVAVQEVEGVGQHADDLARLAVDRERPADRRAVAAELRAPVAGRQHDRFGRGRRVVGLREHAAQHRLRAEHRQDGVRHEERSHFFGLGEAGDAHRSRVPEPDVLEHATFLAIDEVLERRRVRAREVHARRGVIEDDELFGARVREGLEEDAFDDAEDRRYWRRCRWRASAPRRR